MCGIAGYFGSKLIETSIVNETLALMKKRGPNGQKYEKIIVNERKNCYLLHARLSIIDLDRRSDQPFHYNGKTIVYNGEIYNYLEVREELLKLGHVFITQSDTEVLIHALDEWGIETLNKVEGMWSFALYDSKEKSLMFSRDPFGEKPLYVYEPEPGEIYFGSEIKFVAALSRKKFSVNYDHLHRYLINGYKSLFKTQDTFFLGVYAIPKSTVRLYGLDKQRREFKYWHPNIATDENLTFEKSVEKTRELLLSSVKLRLRSDIPIAFCMSGGIDSNSLISIAKSVFNYDVHGFTILNSDSRYEEQDMIDCGVQTLRIRHNGYPIREDNFQENLKELICYHDAPIITISFYLNWLLQAEIARHGYHISISGTAADEMFSGYFDHQLLYLHDVKNNPIHLEKSIANWQRDVRPMVRNPLLQDAHAFIKDPFIRQHAYLNNDKYSSYLKQAWKEPFREAYYREGLLQNRMMNEIFEETTPVSLHEDDLNAMYFSIENRAPFLDRKLFEFCHSIPVKHLIKDGKAKAVLREAMRGIVPDIILDNRKKVGFNAPVTDVFKIDQLAVRNSLLQDSPIWDLFEKKQIEELIVQSHLPNSDSKFLFSFVSAKMFLEEFS